MALLMRHTTQRLMPAAASTLRTEKATNVESSKRPDSLLYKAVRRSFTSMSPLGITRTGCQGISPGGNFVADAVARSLPSVVRIEVETARKELGSGSGFLLSKSILLGKEEQADGVVVVTNAHVVLTPDEFSSITKDKLQSRSLRIECYHGEVLEAHLVCYDTDTDVAVLELSESNLHGAEISLEVMRHGEFVVALGAPLSLENTVTAGIVSNPKRRWDSMTYIQSDLSTHVGSSGGPMINLEGKVIGINVMKLAEGVTLAIPLPDALSVLREKMSLL